MAIPSETPLDAVSLHGLEAGNDVLDVAGEQVAVVRKSVGERRAVVEYVLAPTLVIAGPLFDRPLEGSLVLPAGQNGPLDRWKIGTRGNLGVGRGRAG